MPDSGVAGERPFRPRRVTAIDLAELTADFVGLDGYASVEALVRIAGTPIGVVNQPVVNGRCSGVSLRRAALDQLRWPLARHLLIAGLARGLPENGIDVAALRAIASEAAAPPPPARSVSVVACTRDRPDRLARCLDALIALDPAPDEILVVDNAPTTSAAADVVARYRAVRYVLEARPGLDVARSRGAQASSSEIVAYTDDDVVVDRGWIGALRRAFANPDVSGQDPGVGERRVGNVAGRHAHQSREHDREDDHHRERLQKRPEPAEHRLAVAHVDPMLAEGGEQVEVIAEISQLPQGRQRVPARRPEHRGASAAPPTSRPTETQGWGSGPKTCSSRPSERAGTWASRGKFSRRCRGKHSVR